MNFFLAPGAVLKWLETPSVYQIRNDELYELDDEAFSYLRRCASDSGCSCENREYVDYCLSEGILTGNKTVVKQPPLSKSPVPSLRYLELQITDKCNLRCRHCYIGRRGVHELPVDSINRILHEFEEMQGLRLLITGGEPLLHNDFDSVNSILPDFAFRKVLFTNGLLLRQDKIGRLNIDEIQISIDGLEDAHDSLRGAGTFSKAMKAVVLCINAGLEVSVSTMVHPGNLQDFEMMEKMFTDLGIRDWTVDVPCVTGRLEKNVSFQVAPETAGRYLGYGFGGGVHSGSKGFGCGLHLMSVMADGRVSKCSFYAGRPVGVIEDGLRACWERVRPVKLDELKCDCDQKDACRGGCRYRAELLGDPDGKDLYRCSLYGYTE
jgi:radical SAM protein with 4Fe4S-binding SPASM domain